MQRPDVLDVADDAARDGELARLGIEHFVHGLEQGRLGVFSGLLLPFPCDQHLMPQQGGEQEPGGDGLVLTYALVGVLQRQPDEALAHRLFEDHVQQRQQAVVQAFLAQLLEALDGIARKQELEHLVEQAGCGHVLEQDRHVTDRLAGRGVDCQPELGGQAYRPQHAHRVFTVARARIADHAQGFLLDVGHAVVVIDNGLGAGVVVKGVDGEVAPRRILFLIAVHVVAQHAAVLVGVCRLGVMAGAEGGDLDRLRAAHHMHDLEAATDDARAAERGTYLFGRGAGGDVVVLGGMTDEQVTHGTADDEGLVAILLQDDAHLACRG